MLPLFNFVVNPNFMDKGQRAVRKTKCASRAHSADDNRATVAYRIMRAGELEPWSSDILTAHDPLPDAMLISHLMDQIANRVADKLRERR
jgi:hypothetical protein